LSLFFAILQRVAANRKMPHKAFIINRLWRTYLLQSVAAKCTKVGNEQPSKQPLEVAQKVRQSTFGTDCNLK
jgi:hypothetical protein